MMTTQSDNRTSSMIPHSEILCDNPISKRIEEKEALKKKNKVGGFFGNLFKGKSKKDQKHENQDA